MNLDVRVRYTPIVEHLNKKFRDFLDEGPKILEVGAGPTGVAQFISKLKIISVDINTKDNFDNNNVIPVKASVASLPFVDECFDIVLSVDMLEHIERKDRKRAIMELLRVSQDVIIIACPCGRISEIYEKLIFDLIRKLTGIEHKWLKDHVNNGLPTEQEIFDAVPRKSFSSTVLGNYNIHVWFISTIFRLGLFYFIPDNLILKGIHTPTTKFLLKCLKKANLSRPYRKIFIFRRYPHQ